MDRVKSFYSKNREVSRLFIIMIAWLIFMLLTQAGKFFTGANFLTMAGQFPEYGLMALGGMLCMMTGGIDLSVVGTANMTTIISVYVLNWIFGVDGTMPAGFSVVIFLIAILTGCVIGAFNGFLISELKVPPILATLGVNQLITGLCIVITGGAAVSSFPKLPRYHKIGRAWYLPSQNNFAIFFLRICLALFRFVCLSSYWWLLLSGSCWREVPMGRN